MIYNCLLSYVIWLATFYDVINVHGFFAIYYMISTHTTNGVVAMGLESFNALSFLTNNIIEWMLFN